MRCLATAFIKIDVEGAELEVLYGFVTRSSETDRWLLLKSYRVIPTRTETDLTVKKKCRSTFDLRIMAAHVFKRLRLMGLAGLVRIDEIGIHSDLNDCDYLWLPAEHTDGIMSLMHLTSDHN